MPAFSEDDARDMMAVVSALIHHPENSGGRDAVAMDIFDQACARNSEVQTPLRQLGIIFGAMFMDMDFLNHVQCRDMDSLNLVLPWNDTAFVTAHVNIAMCVAAAMHNMSLIEHIGVQSDAVALCCVMDAITAITMLVDAIDRLPESVKSEVTQVLSLTLSCDATPRSSFVRQQATLSAVMCCRRDIVNTIHYLMRCWVGSIEQRNELFKIVATANPDHLSEALEYTVVDRNTNLWALDMLINEHGVHDSWDNSALRQACTVSNFAAIRMLLEVYNPDNAAYPLDAKHGLLACRNVLVATNHVTHPFVAMHLDPAIARHILGLPLKE